MRHLLRNQKKTSQSKLSSLGRPVEYVNKKFHNQKFWVEIQKKKKEKWTREKGTKDTFKILFWTLDFEKPSEPMPNIANWSSRYSGSKFTSLWDLRLRVVIWQDFCDLSLGKPQTHSVFPLSILSLPWVLVKYVLATIWRVFLWEKYLERKLIAKYIFDIYYKLRPIFICNGYQNNF